MEEQQPKKKRKLPEGMKPWVPGQSGNLNGRPKKFVNGLIKDGYTTEEVTRTIKNLITLTPDQLIEIQKNKEITSLEMTVSKAILNGIDRGDLSALEILLTRIFGKPKEKIEQDIRVAHTEIKMNFDDETND